MVTRGRTPMVTRGRTPMVTSRNSAMTLTITRLRRGLIRTALAGVTPQLISLIAALLLARMLSATIGDFFVQLHAHALGEWLLRFLANFGQLLTQRDLQAEQRFHLLFERAWQRIEAGDVPKYDEVTR